MRENARVGCLTSRRLRTAIASAFRVTGINLACLRLVRMDPPALPVEIALVPLESGRLRPPETRGQREARHVGDVRGQGGDQAIGLLGTLGPRSIHCRSFTALRRMARTSAM